MGLRTRLLLLVLLPVIPALVLAIYTNLEQRRFGRIRVEKDAIREVQLAAAKQQGLIEATRHHLAALARLPQARGTNFAAYDAFFANMTKVYADYNDFGLIETNGDLVASSFGRKGVTNLLDHAHVRRVLKTKDFVIGNFQAGDGTRQPSLPFGHPIFDESGRLARILYAALDLAVLNGVTARMQIPRGSAITIFDREGHVLARYPEPEKWVGNTYSETTLVKAIMAEVEGTVERPGLDGVPKLNAFTA